MRLTYVGPLVPELSSYLKTRATFQIVSNNIKPKLFMIYDLIQKMQGGRSWQIFFTLITTFSAQGLQKSA